MSDQLTLQIVATISLYTRTNKVSELCPNMYVDRNLSIMACSMCTIVRQAMTFSPSIDKKDTLCTGR